MKNCLFGAKSLRINDRNGGLTNYSVDLLQQSYNIAKPHPLIKNLLIPLAIKEQQLKIYQWRSKTEFPIIKIHEFRLLGQKNNSLILQIKAENFLTTLGQVYELPLFKVLYLLKEAIIGFERLFHKFGPFLLTPSMIIINTQYKCKVWVNQNPSSNSFLKILMSQQIFLGSICRIFEQRSNKLRNTTKFFLEISKKQTFYQALSFIEIYAKKNRINIPDSCKILLSEKIENYKPNGNKIVSSPMIKSPKFIKKAEMRLSLKATTCKRYIPSKKDGSWNANKSGWDTAPDIQNNQLSKSIYEGGNEVKQDNKKKQNITKEGVFKSQVPVKVSPISSFSFGRKYNSNIEFLSEIKSLNLGSSPRKDLIDQQAKVSLKKKTSLGQINDQQNEETTKLKEEQVYNKNHWQKSIQFLLNDLNVKSSVHLGQDIRKTQKCTIRLERLDTIGQKVTESFIKMPGQTGRQVDSILFTSQI